jgi:hypothetical protein
MSAKRRSCSDLSDPQGLGPGTKPKFGDSFVMGSWIDSYVGERKDAAGNCLSIRKISDETARVTFLAAPGRAPKLGG